MMEAAQDGTGGDGRVCIVLVQARWCAELWTLWWVKWWMTKQLRAAVITNEQAVWKKAH